MIAAAETNGSALPRSRTLRIVTDGGGRGGLWVGGGAGVAPCRLEAPQLAAAVIGIIERTLVRDKHAAVRGGGQRNRTEVLIAFHLCLNAAGERNTARLQYDPVNSLFRPDGHEQRSALGEPGRPIAAQ